jgi:uncharacterized membrane protein (UPF0182 family)
MGYSQVFITIIKSKLILGIVAAAVFFVFAFINAYAASRSYVVSRTVEDETEVILPENLNTIIVGIIAAVSLFFGLAVSGSWELVLRYVNSESFGTLDPIFGLDIGFYIFELPFYEAALRAGFAVLAFTGVITLLVYLLKSKSILFDMTFSDVKFETPKFTKWAKAHLFFLLAIFFVLVSASYRLQAFDLLMSARSDTYFGPGVTDLTVTIPALKFLVFLSLFTALSFILNIWLQKPWISAGLIILLLAVQILGVGLYAGLVQEYSVQPNEIVKETPYIENNIEYTSKAFGLEDVTERMFEVGTNLSAENIEENSATIGNIRLLDPRTLKDTYRQIQEIRLYYEFNDVDVDRYTIDGEYVQLMLSAREIDPSGLPTSAQNWINEHLVYTHGYGIVASPVNRISSKGLPELLIKDIPPSTDSIQIDKPEIYFGEMTTDYVIVNTNTEEFDYPSGDENQYTKYSEDSGVALSSYLRKLVMALRFGTPKIILSDDITDGSRILYKRSIREITGSITPFLAYDRDPYIVTEGGRLYWILDAYTASDRYPYSTKTSNINYIRNPVKVVIDAYTGKTTFYIVDESDPIIRTYAKIFPDLFETFAEMPDDLKVHIRYPEDMFTIQAQTYAKYHMKDPRVFYNLEDMWNIPDELYESRRIKMDPYYIIMKIPGEEKEEFILMQPFTPRNKNNMIAWMYARSDPEHYGKLGVFKFPKQELIFGPMQIEALIDQDSQISEQLTLWGQVGSRVIRGNLLVIPIENSILYVEPLYLLAEESQLPQLERVIIAFGDRIVMEENLEDALAAIFGVLAESAEIPSDDLLTEDGAASRALQIYERALKELREGDWKGFGESLEALEEELKKLKAGEGS